MKGSIQKRSDRTYRLRVDLGLDASGRRIQRSLTVRGSRKEAEKKLAEIINEIHKGEYVGPSALTVAEYMRYWLENYARKLAARTFENYADYTRLYIIPGLGNVRLQELQPLHIQAFFAQLEQGGRKRNGQPLSPTTIFHCHRVLKGALRRAVQWQMLARNPAEGVTPPRMAEYSHRILTPEQVGHLLRSARDGRLYVPVLMALCTGLRRGEICGLRWKDIDFETGLLAVRQTLVCVRSGVLEFKAPKTRTGRRSLPLPSVLVDALREERLRQEELRSTLGPTYNERGLVVCREDGHPLNPTTLYKAFQLFLVRLNLPRVAVHDLRHSHATHLLEAGIHPKTVAERLGHSDPALTLRVYSHALDHIQQEAANRTDELLRRMIGHDEDGEKP